jgi:hypothetical protein
MFMLINPFASLRLSQRAFQLMVVLGLAASLCAEREEQERGNRLRRFAMQL